MQVYKTASCEQCHRQVKEHQIVKVECDQHVGYVCSVCHYLLNKDHQQERFKAMIRKKTYEQSNPDMKGIHRYLSMLITVGIAFCIVIVGAMFV